MVLSVSAFLIMLKGRLLQSLVFFNRKTVYGPSFPSKFYVRGLALNDAPKKYTNTSICDT